jgi:hypothetical protein
LIGEENDLKFNLHSMIESPSLLYMTCSSISLSEGTLYPLKTIVVPGTSQTFRELWNKSCKARPIELKKKSDRYPGNDARIFRNELK